MSVLFFSPSPVVVDFGVLQVHWYGLIMTLAIVAAMAVALRLAPRAGVTKSDLWDLAFYLVIFGLVGARLYHVLNEIGYYAQYPNRIVAVWQGGLALHGALIAGLIVVYVFVKKKGVNFWKLSDILALSLLVGQIIGRWGNFFNQELFGKPSDAPWAIFIRPENRPTGYGGFQYFHPTFFYEFVLNLFLFVILWWWYKKKSPAPGVVFLWYIVGYSLIRFMMEFVRIDRTPIIAGVRVPQIISVIAIGIVGYIWVARKKARGSAH